MKLSLSVFISFGLLFLISCTRSANPDINRGSTYDYKPGFPEVRFAAVGFLNEDNNASISLAADIVYGSLTYKTVNNQQQADINIDVRIVSKEDTENIIDSESYQVNIDRNDPGIIESQQSYVFEKQLPVSPGSYTVYLTVTDQISRQKITRVADTNIPDPSSPSINLTDIRMLGKDMNSESPSWLPITTYSVPGKADSLMFIFQATNSSSENPLPITAKLVRFRSDTTVARPMNLNDYSRSTIQYKGIELSEQTIIQTTERKLQEKGSVFIEFRFAQQQRGNYRFEVTSNKENSDLFKARTFGIKSTNYPDIKTPKELASPLVYLMDRDKHEKLMSTSNPDSMKKFIDEFWLSEIGNKNKAQSVLRLFYDRVVEANKQFSNFKEGWKTDTGMIYILFGPPWYSEVNFDELRWGYSYNRSDPELNYVFFQPEIESEFFPFQHFLLQRRQSYFDVRYQQRSLWLSGLILERRI